MCVCVYMCVSSKVVRRTSVNERSSLYRREHHKEAMVWQDRGRQDRQTEDEDEDRQTDSELKHMVSKHTKTQNAGGESDGS